MKPMNKSTVYIIPASFLTAFGILQVGSSYDNLAASLERESTGSPAFAILFLLTLFSIVVGIGLLMRIRGSYSSAVVTTGGMLFFVILGLIQVQQDRPDMPSTVVQAQFTSIIGKAFLLIATLALLLPGSTRSVFTRNGSEKRGDYNPKPPRVD